jgi:hypothetical protein
MLARPPVVRAGQVRVGQVSVAVLAAETNDRAEGHRGPPPVPSAYGENVARPEKTSIPRDPFPVQSACAFAFVEATAM